MWARRLASGAGAAGVLLVAAAAGSAENLHYTCSSRALIRQVEVREDPARNLACEVLYRKETENPGVEQVLWSAQRDHQFCTEKAEGLVELLESHGWACEPAGASAAAPERVEARVRPEPKPEASPAAPARDQAGVRPEPKSELAPADAGTDQARVPPELKPEPPITVPAVARPSREPDPVLRTAIAQDLEQLKGSTEATVDAEVGALGDLNGDGREDAAVMITFDPDGDDHAQYLVAYVADGQTFRPAASKFLGGRYREIYGGEIEDIQAGEIHVSLQVLKANDPYCCPSGQQPASFTLQGDELLRRE
jgi:hypothetical protein